ncbi:DnaA N-terminal domain-containing protein [Sutcliffiella sp. NPDC057660]|uniref:DnaA N-terminal domain-containing protein n=1 Tax=Sutcliffiella sp. NPDC057660 TaxID=3346199 RepID=UPI00367B7ADA
MDKLQLWNKVLEIIRKEISEKAFTTWFKNTGIKSLTDDEIVIYATNDFAADWVRKNYSQLIGRSSSAILNKEMKISITSKSSEEAESTIN